MLAGTDRHFGNRGSLWSGMPTDYVDPWNAKQDTYYVGGTATGLHISGDGSLRLVVWGWAPEGKFWASEARTTVRVLRFPGAGQPEEYLRWDGTDSVRLGEADRYADPLASCTVAGDSVAILMRQSPSQGRPGSWSYSVRYDSDPSEKVVDSALFYDLLGQPRDGGIRMGADGTEVVVVSARGTWIRVASLKPGATAYDFDLSSEPTLPGLTDLEVASVSYRSGTVSIGLTANLNHPLLGATSIGAVLRVSDSGARVAGFAGNGVWASPLGPGFRGFVCAGEFSGLVAGCAGSRAVVLAVDASDSGGSGLDASFGVGGLAVLDLGGHLAMPVAAADATGLYLLANRAPAHVGGLDGRVVGCRLRLAPGLPGHGQPDPAWGNGGILTAGLDGASVLPVALVLDSARLVLGGTRQLRGQDLDRAPFALVLDAATGIPDAGFGAGGFALHDNLQQPAHVDEDGSAVFVVRQALDAVPALQSTNGAGEAERFLSLTSLPAGTAVSTLTRLPDGGLLVAGGGPTPLIVKLDASFVVDSSFGSNGVVSLAAGTDGVWASVVGVQSNGDINVRVNGGLTSQLLLLHGDGMMDAAYGGNGLVDIKTFTHRFSGSTNATCFLTRDGGVLIVVWSSRDSGSQDDAVTVGLRKVTVTGEYDDTFGLGPASANDPTDGQSMVLTNIDNTSEVYQRVMPAGAVWLGDRLYVVATGSSGYFDTNAVRPAYPLLVILGWHADNGTVDETYFGQGLQEAGFTPDHLYYSASGVIQDSPTSCYICGAAGTTEVLNTTIVRQPQPALFRLEHPAGLDRGFAGVGAATTRLQEFLLTPVAGALVGHFVRVACVDQLKQAQTDRPKTGLSGLVQWSTRPSRWPGAPHH